MTAKEIEKYKKILLRMRERLIAQVNSIEEALRDDISPHGEGAAAPTHIADEAAEGVDEQIILAHSEGQLLEDVEDALARIEAGTYGACENCGQPIANERLEALPQTPWCIKCAKLLADNEPST